MDGTIWVAPADNPEVHGTSANASGAGDSSQAWTLTLSNIPAHTMITQAGFNVAVFEQQDDGCGGSCCGGSCGGSCGGGCGGSSGDDTFSFTLSLNGNVVAQLSFDQSDASWSGSDDSGNPGWGSGFNPDQMPIVDGGDTENWTITPDIPGDDGYRHYTWTVGGGEVSAGTDAWVTGIQDAYRQTPPQPAILQVNRDLPISHGQTIYYTLGGTAIHGVLNDDGSYTPADADYTGGAAVPGYGNLYSVTIPAGAASAQVQFTPVVPYINPLDDPEKSIGIMLSGDPNPPENVIVADAPNTATEPAGKTQIQHGLNISSDIPGELTFDQINNLVNQLNNSTTTARNNIASQLTDGIMNAPSNSVYSWMMYEWDDWADGPSYVDDTIMNVIQGVWGYGYLSFGNDGNGHPTLTIPMPSVPNGAAFVGFMLDQTGNSIVYHFGVPGQQLGKASSDAQPIGTAPPLIYMDVKNPGVSSVSVKVIFFDANMLPVTDDFGRPLLNPVVNLALNVVQT